MVVHTCNPRLGRLRQEDCESQASLGYIVTVCLKNNKQKKTGSMAQVIGYLPSTNEAQSLNPSSTKRKCTRVKCLPSKYKAHSSISRTEKKNLLPGTTPQSPQPVWCCPLPSLGSLIPTPFGPGIQFTEQRSKTFIKNKGHSRHSEHN
jgi:hypothetical protein